MAVEKGHYMYSKYATSKANGRSCPGKRQGGGRTSQSTSINTR